MKLQKSYEIVTGTIALALLAIIVTVKFIQGGRDAKVVPFLLLITSMTVLVTFLLCSFRVARKKPVSYGTMLVGSFGSTFLVFVCGLFYSDGWSIFTAYYWHDTKGGLFGLLFCATLVGCICLLPAFAIVVYYQKRIKTGEKDEA